MKIVFNEELRDTVSDFLLETLALGYVGAMLLVLSPAMIITWKYVNFLSSL